MACQKLKHHARWNGTYIHSSGFKKKRDQLSGYMCKKDEFNLF